MKKRMILILAMMAHLSLCFATIVGSTLYKGEVRYVDVVSSGPTAVVWLKTDAEIGFMNQGILVMQMYISNLPLQTAAQEISRSKMVYEGGKTIIGSLAERFSGACVSTADTTGADMAAYCYVQLTGNDPALVDAMKPMVYLIASELATKHWGTYAQKACLVPAAFSDLLQDAILAAYQDLK